MNIIEDKILNNGFLKLSSENLVAANASKKVAPVAASKALDADLSRSTPSLKSHELDIKPSLMELLDKGKDLSQRIGKMNRLSYIGRAGRLPPGSSLPGIKGITLKGEF